MTPCRQQLPDAQAALVTELFDMRLRALRRDRAAILGPERFLADRVFEDCLARISLMNRRFERSLLVGCPGQEWPGRLQSVAQVVEVKDPGPLFAVRACGEQIIEDAWEPPPEAYDLIVAIGTLDTVNDLPLSLRLVLRSMRSGGFFIGALSGGDTLPRLRSAVRAADKVVGFAAARIHPRIEASALSPLLLDAGFIKPVVDVERIQVSYPSLERLVADLRAMGATNSLLSRSPPLTRVQRSAAARSFEDAGKAGRTIETFEILHFAAWSPPNRMMPR